MEVEATAADSVEPKSFVRKVLEPPEAAVRLQEGRESGDGDIMKRAAQLVTRNGKNYGNGLTNRDANGVRKRLESLPAAACGSEDGSLVLGHGLGQMMASVEVVLQGIGEDVEREGLRKTPLRVASAFQGALAGYKLSAQEIIGPALFTEAGASGGTGCGGGSGGIVVVSNIDLFALCESCFLPYRLRCHVVYVPCGQRVVGLSKFPRVAEIFAKRLQNPQKFADELVEALNESFRPLGVGVVVETWHLQWPALCREADKVSSEANGALCSEERVGVGWVPVTVCAGKGQFKNFQSSLWDEVLTILQLEGVDLERASLDGADADGQAKERKLSCPFLVYDEQGGASTLGNYHSSPEVKSNGSSGHGNTLADADAVASAAAMALGVESLLRAMSVDSSKDQLRCTAGRFVKWILAATQGSRVSSFPSVPLPQQNGLDGCGLNGRRANGTVVSNGNGLLSYGGPPGPENEHGVVSKGSIVNGFAAVHSNGTAHSNGTSSNGSSYLSDGALSNHHHDRVESVSANGHSRIVSNGTMMSNGSSASRGEVVAGVEHLSEGVLCLELDVSFASLCEHHLLPFLGVVHVGYIRAKGSQPIDRALVLKIVAMYSRRLQVQERLTRQIVEAMASFAGLQGAMVVAEASHMCIMSRGVEKTASSTATVATIGKFSTDGAIRAAFLKRLPRKGVNKLQGQ